MANKLLLGDLHLGYGNGDSFITERQAEFFENFLFPFISSGKIEEIIQVGDWYDNKKIPNTNTISFSNWVIAGLLNSGVSKIIHLDGNHDLYDRVSNEISSFHEIHGFRDKVLSISKDIFTDQNMVFVPYGCNNNINFDDISGKDVFGHFDILGFRMREGVNSTIGFDGDKFKKAKIVLSGHYHNPSKKGNILYLGTPYEMEWNDYGCKHFVYIYDNEKDIIKDKIKPVEYSKSIFSKVYFNGVNIVDLKNNAEIKDANDLSGKIIKIYTKDTDINTAGFDKISSELNRLCHNVDIIDHRTIKYDLGDENQQSSPTDIEMIEFASVKREFFDSMLDKNENKELVKKIETEFDNLYEKERLAISTTPVNGKYFHFNEISFKNIFSYGNKMFSHKFNSGMTLISGENGVGKTTIIEAIFIAIKNKSFRGVTKGEIVNAINKKEALIILDVNVGKDNYIITRGIKPDIFEVRKNGEALKSPSSPELQKIVDNLFCDDDTLKQTILISMMDYVPFMKLNAEKRRSYLEEYFNFEVLNRAMKTARAENIKLASEIISIDASISSTQSNNTILQNELDNWQQHKKNQIDIFNKSIEDCNNTININRIKIDAVVKEMTNMNISSIDNLINETQKSIQEYMEKIYKADVVIKMNTNLKTLFEKNDACPTCARKIDEEERKKTTSLVTEKIEKIEKAKPAVILTLRSMEKQISEYKILKDNYNLLQKQIDTLNLEIKQNDTQIEIIKGNINAFNNTIAIKEDSIKESLVSNLNLIAEYEQKKLDSKDKQYIYSYLINILDDKKDNNIRQAVINKWINYIEVETNKYLEIMSAGYLVKFDNSLNIVANPLERTYKALSAGQRQRLDLALLFVFNQISKLKNIGINGNILFFDEILDSSLDIKAISGLIAIFKIMAGENRNCYVISHKDNIASMFDNVINLSIENRFTVIKNAI